MSDIGDTLPRLREEAYGGSQASPFSRLLSSIFPLTWESALVGAIFVSAAVTRLWALGARVMSHDESLHVYYSWLLATGKGFSHNPMMHGPSLFEFTALMDVFFGANDFSSRLVPAILGILIVVAIPQLLKGRLGRAGALAASVLLLISPYILYYSRYIRHDVQVIAWSLLAVAAIFRYLENRRDRYLVWLAVALALMLSTMEIAFMYLAIFAGYLAMQMIARYRNSWRALRASAEFDLIVVLATLGAFFSSPIATLFLNPVWARFSGEPFVDLKALEAQGIDWVSGAPGLRLWILLGIFSIAAVLIGLWWGGRRWLKLAGIFGAITVTLFTTFFTNPAGLATGFIGSLGYWLAQQGVARGSQPWYYYLVVFPIYEYLPIFGSLAAGIFYWIKRKSLSEAERVFVPFLMGWGLSIFAALSLAGEKMPWLSTHITIPLILLSGWWVGQLLGRPWNWGTGWREHARSPVWTGALGFTLILVVLTTRTAYAVNYANYDYTTEYIDYAHGAPGVKWVLADIQSIANHTGLGQDLKVAFDDQVSWPMNWYLRDYPNKSYFGDQPNRQALDAPVVLAGPQNWSKVEAFLGSQYHRFEVIRLWWPLEDYKNLSWERIRFALTDPSMRSALWDILWQRDYRQYAQATGQAIDPPTHWPLSESMRVYVRRDIALQMLSFSLGPAMLEDLPAPEDAYASVTRDLSPAQLAGTGELNAPRGLAIGPDGSLYVADSNNARVVKYDSQGSFVTQWGSRTPDGQTPPAPGTFNEPWGIAVDGAGNVFVADTWNHRVQKFDREGKFLLEWGTAGQASEGKDRLWGPRGIAVSPDGGVYLTDTGNKRVLAFSQDGKFLAEFGTQGEGRLDEPVGIAVGSDGRVYVADTWNRRVAVFTGAGQFLTSWPVQGWASDSIEDKPYLALDAQGRVYLSDPEGYRVIALSPEGKPLVVFGQYGPEENAFGLPIGVGADPAGVIWVADAGNNRLVKYDVWNP
jgi:uncharacterized protein (TIGR03663 family)